MAAAVQEVYGAVQSYDWGRLGKDGSQVSELAGAAIPGWKDKSYSADKPYAEVGVYKV